MPPRHVTVTPDDIAAHLDYRCARARHDALKLGGGLALTAGIAVGITASLLSAPLVGLICGVIPAALVLYNALRQTNPTRWRAKLAKWLIPDRIPTGPMPLTTHDKSVSPPPDHKPTLPNGQTGATLRAPAAEDVGRALVGVARTTRHCFVRLRFHHAWAIPLPALPPPTAPPCSPNWTRTASPCTTCTKPLPSSKARVDTRPTPKAAAPNSTPAAQHPPRPAPPRQAKHKADEPTSAVPAAASLVSVCRRLVSVHRPLVSNPAETETIPARLVYVLAGLVSVHTAMASAVARLVS